VKRRQKENVEMNLLEALSGCEVNWTCSRLYPVAVSVQPLGLTIMGLISSLNALENPAVIVREVYQIHLNSRLLVWCMNCPLD
jgi:hypothetical protein